MAFPSRPPNTGIKPFNPVTQERQLVDLKRAVAPAPSMMHQVMPQVAPVAPVQIPSANPNFSKLRAMFAKGR